MRHKHKLFNFILSLFIIFNFPSCSYNEATGKNQFNWVSDEKEVKIGKSAHAQIQRQHGLYRDPELSRYINHVGQKVVKFCGRTNINYYFTVLDSPMINAFALPGGYVYVTRGVLAQMNSEAELAFVLGHEVAHIAAKHGAQRITQAEGIGAALRLASILLKESANDWGAVVNKVVELSVMGYGRQNEFESDMLGADYSHQASYSIEAGSEFLRTLKKQEKYESNWLAQLHSSHPPTAERINRIQDKIDELEASENIKLMVRKSIFLNKINGLFMGNYPQSGQRKGDTYKNYQYGFSLNVPKEWAMSATLSKSIVKLKYKDMASGSITVEKVKSNQKNTSTTKIVSLFTLYVI
tara:strand:+ start:2460 stop:3518 length:1059 start_codon:yes stop_codon:yes gene_type:complete